jgi:hypothetical protein
MNRPANAQGIGGARSGRGAAGAIAEPRIARSSRRKAGGCAQRYDRLGDYKEVSNVNSRRPLYAGY